jgi:alpha-tubulin suppressor-like RCC1 family protein
VKESIMTTGVVSSWGDNALGQLADTGVTGRSTPGDIKGLDGVTMIDAGSGHVVAVREDGTVWGWGRNSFGQLGDGTMTDRSEPVQVKGLTDVVKAGGGGGHSVAVRKDGTVWAWGAGFFGAIGPATFELRPVPVQVTGIDGVVDLCVGGAHNLVLRGDGTLWTWGRDDHGQLGDGGVDRPGRSVLEYQAHTFPVRPTPAPVEGVHGVRALGAGGGQSLAILADGTLLAWGFNDFGQLGDGTTSDRFAPAKVEGLPAGVVSASGGYHHTVLALEDGTVWACGLNDGGQVGDDSTTNRAVPVQVANLTTAVAVSANGGGTDAQPGGGGHTAALLADGTVWSWGWNNYGQLGDGTTANRPVPVQVANLTKVRSIAAGGEIPPTNTFNAVPVGGFLLALR